MNESEQCNKSMNKKNKKKTGRETFANGAFSRGNWAPMKNEAITKFFYSKSVQ